MLYKITKSCTDARVFIVCQDSNMEQENFLSGGVALFHALVDGKHCYEVDKVLTTKPSDLGRKGDKIMMINDVETEHLPPKTFVRMLSSGSPVLTIHRASIDEEEKKCPESESMRPYHKERTVLDFSLAMVRETCLDKDEENPLVPEESEWESGDPESDSFTEEEFLLVSMTNTSVSIIEARGCDDQKSCNICGGAGCTLNDVVVGTTQSNITSVCRKYVEKNFESDQVLVQSLLKKNICPENIPHPGCQTPRTRSPTTANITIYYYMSNAEEDFDKGVPVVLNFSQSTNFLKCICKNDRPVLTIECCEKSKLQSICKDDPFAWPFVFYLKTTKDNQRHFESAMYSGWFIHTKPSGLVCVDRGADFPESNFYILVHL